MVFFWPLASSGVSIPHLLGMIFPLVARTPSYIYIHIGNNVNLSRE